MLYPELDTATLAIAGFAIDFVLMGLLIHTWRTRTTYSGFLAWIMATVCWSIGSLLNIVLAAMHPVFIPKIIGNTLLMLHPLFLFEGIRRFYGIRGRWWGTPLSGVVVLCGLLNTIYFLYIVDNTSARTIGVCLVLGLLLLHTSLEPLFYSRVRRNSMQWVLSGIMLPVIALLFAYLWTHLSGFYPESFTEVIRGSNMLRWIMFYVLIVELILAYCYLSLTSDRVESELRQSKESYRELSSSLQAKVEEEARLRMIQERLLANQSRHAAMGKMISAIAHQWRQPLSTLGMIIQRTHALGTRKEITPQYLNEFKENAMHQISYMSDTIDEFSGFYRPGRVKEFYSPIACIHDSVRIFKPQFTNNGIEVEITSPGWETKRTNGYANEFKQIILNLLSNSRDAIQESRITKGEPGTGRIGVKIGGGATNIMTIDISDNGCGLAADISPHIFEPYFTTKEESGGTGIGLYMSRMLLENSMRGRITLIKHTGGATFRIELPLEEQP